jgi:hypothetical protein
VIQFGSCIDGKFVLDTVFVVSQRHETHDATTWKRLKKDVPAGYWDITLRAWYESEVARCGAGCTKPDPVQSFRLYWGATYDNPDNGMFSFVPCQPAAETPEGFPRPFIERAKFINDVLAQGFKHNKQLGLTEEKVRRFWDVVREQVEKCGLRLGVYNEMPPRRTNTGTTQS